jgi:hypothetical protein
VEEAWVTVIGRTQGGVQKMFSNLLSLDLKGGLTWRQMSLEHFGCMPLMAHQMDQARGMVNDATAHQASTPTMSVEFHVAYNRFQSTV